MASPAQPLVVSLMQAFKADLLASEQQAMARMVDAWRPVEARLADRVELLARDIADRKAAGLSVSQSAILQLERTQSLLRQARQEIDSYTDRIADPLITQRQAQLVGEGIGHAEVALNAAGVRGAFDRLPAEELQGLVGLAGDGSPLRQTLANSYGYGADGILNELLTGVGVGRNPREMAARAIRNGLSQSLNHMLVTMRTETLRTYRVASQESYRRSGVVRGYRRLATLDRRTCPGCLAAHGSAYLLDVEFQSHPQCRCTLIPQVLGAPDMVLESAEQWFNRQSRETQLSIMGPGRMAHLDRGGSFADLATVRDNATWGAAVVPTPVREL